MKKYLWPVVIVLGALVVAVLVLVVLGLKPHEEPILETKTGLSRRTWVAAVGRGPARGAAAAVERALPSGVDWRYFDGDADAEIVGVLGLSMPSADDLHAALVDRSGRVRGRWKLLADAPPDPVSLEALVDAAGFHRRLSFRPLLHACLNGGTAIVLTLGFLFIRRRRVAAHLACMALAGSTTLVFLASYLDYHYHAGSMPFAGAGGARALYLGVLLTHTVLAALVAPLALTLYILAARKRFTAHRRVARWALPMWLYVSVTGVLIYLMLYVWFAPA